MSALNDILYKNTEEYLINANQPILRKYIFKSPLNINNTDTEPDKGSFNFIYNDILYDNEGNKIQDMTAYFRYKNIQLRMFNNAIRVCNLQLTSILGASGTSIIKLLSKNNGDIRSIYGSQYGSKEFFDLSKIMISVYKIYGEDNKIKIPIYDNTTKKENIKITILSSNYFDIEFNETSSDALYYEIHINRGIENIYASNPVDKYYSLGCENEFFEFNNKLCIVNDIQDYYYDKNQIIEYNGNIFYFGYIKKPDNLSTINIELDKYGIEHIEPNYDELYKYFPTYCRNYIDNSFNDYSYSANFIDKLSVDNNGKITLSIPYKHGSIMIFQKGKLIIPESTTIESGNINIILDKANILGTDGMDGYVVNPPLNVVISNAFFNEDVRFPIYRKLIAVTKSDTRYSLIDGVYEENINGNYIKSNSNYFEIQSINGKEYYRSNEYILPVNKNIDPNSVAIAIEKTEQKYKKNEDGTYTENNSGEYVKVDDQYLYVTSKNRYKVSSLSNMIKLMSNTSAIVHFDDVHRDRDTIYSIKIMGGEILDCGFSNTTEYENIFDIEKAVDDGDDVISLDFNNPILEVVTDDSIIAYNISNGYSEFHINDEDDNFLAYEIPEQIMCNEGRILTFINGLLINEYQIDKRLWYQLFDGQAVLSLSSDLENSNINSVFITSAGTYALYQDIHGISLVNDSYIIELSDDIDDCVMPNYWLFNDFYMTPISNKTMLIFVNGHYIDENHIEIISNRRFVFKNLSEIIGNTEINDIKIYRNTEFKIPEWMLKSELFIQYPDKIYNRIIYKINDSLWDDYKETIINYYNDSSRKDNYKVSINPTSKVFNDSISTNSLMEIFGKYVLNKGMDLTADDITNTNNNEVKLRELFESEVRLYFDKLYDSDDRLVLDYEEDNDKRKFNY